MARTQQPESLPAKLYLLTYQPGRGRFGRPSELGTLLRGAALVDLTLRGCLRDEDGKATPAGTARSGDRLLDGMLREIREAGPKSWRAWIRRGGNGTVRAVRQQLAAARVIDIEERRVLGLFPGHRISLRDMGFLRRIQDEVLEALRGNTDVDQVEESDAALVALAVAGQLTSAVSRPDRRRYADRITALGERGGDAVPALHKVIRQIRMARAAAHSG